MTHSREELIADIRRACIEANPNIVERSCKIDGGPHACANCEEMMGGEIRLADVLFLLGSDVSFDGTGRIMTKQYGESFHDTAGCSGHWILRDDDLDKQSIACILFIHGLVK